MTAFDGRRVRYVLVNNLDDTSYGVTRLVRPLMVCEENSNQSEFAVVRLHTFCKVEIGYIAFN